MSELFVQLTHLFGGSHAIAHVIMLWACSMNANYCEDYFDPQTEMVSAMRSAEVCVTGSVQGFPAPTVYMLPMSSPVKGQYWPLTSVRPYTVDIRRPWIMTPAAKRELQGTLRHEAAHAVKDMLGEPPFVWNGSEWIDNDSHSPRECFFGE